MLKKRLLAWIIDIMVIVVIIFIVSIIYKPNTKNLQIQNDQLIIRYYEKKINFDTYLSNSSKINQKIDQKNIVKNIITFLIITIYFVVIPYIKNGKTLGKNILKIKVKPLKGKLKLHNLFLRNLINNGLFFYIALITLTLISPENYYFIIISISEVLQILMFLIDIFLIIYRSDQRGLHDLIGKTKVGV